MWDETFPPTSKQVFCYKSLPAAIKSIIAEECIFGVEACLDWISVTDKGIITRRILEQNRAYRLLFSTHI